MVEKRSPNSNLTPIGQVLETIVERCRCDTGGGIAHLARVWKAMIGPPITDHAKPFAVKGRLLLVHVSSSVWLHQLGFLKTELLHKLNRGLKNEPITDIRFKIGPL